MELINTYIETKDFEKSINFYKKVLQIEPKVFCEGRWVEFEAGNTLALYNRRFDEENIKAGQDLSKNYNAAYLAKFKLKTSEHRNTIVTFNFYTDNLKQEYERIQSLNLSTVSEIMYVNIVAPYYYFTIHDPDGNILEICSENYE